MGQFSKVLYQIDNAHTVSQRVLDLGPGLDELSHIFGPKDPTPSTCLECLWQQHTFIYDGVQTRCELI